jgi:hypothetical protein
MDEARFLADVLACRHRFIVQFFGLRGVHDDGKTWAHANAIVVDVKTGTLTRYEPHGAKTGLYDAKPLDSQLAELVRRHPDIFFGRYEPPRDYCPRVGPQTKADRKQDFVLDGVERKESGWCAAFSAMFLHYRVAHPELSTRQIAEMLATGKQLEEDLRSYVNFMILNTK